MRVHAEGPSSIPGAEVAHQLISFISVSKLALAVDGIEIHLCTGWFSQ